MDMFGWFGSVTRPGAISPYLVKNQTTITNHYRQDQHHQDSYCNRPCCAVSGTAPFFIILLHISFIFAVIGFACPVSWEARSRKIV